MEILDKIKQQIKSNDIILYMKGSPGQPQCGFSAKVAQVLTATGAKFAHVDVLENPEIRAALPRYADWPTFPQLYIKGELVGGCDIVSELNESGELEKMVKESTE